MYADVEDDYFSFNKIPRILFKDRQRCVVYMHVHVHVHNTVHVQYVYWLESHPSQRHYLLYDFAYFPSCIVMHEYRYIYMYTCTSRCIVYLSPRSGLMCEVRAEASTVRALLHMFSVNVVCS